MTENQCSTGSERRQRLLVKPKVPYTKGDGLCCVLDCTEAPERGALCPEHQAGIAEDFSADLREAGLDIPGAGLLVLVDQNRYMRVMDRRRKPMPFWAAHRLVMSTVLGRELLPTESVHHKNGVKWDNSPGNLELWATPQPPGQRPHDLADYARQILSLYGTDDEQERYRAP